MSADPIEVRLAILETQIERIVSDIESEKGTRARVNSDIIAQLHAIDTTQRKLEKMLWMGIGGLAVLQFLVPMVIK